MGTKRREAKATGPKLEPEKMASAEFWQPMIDGMAGHRGARTKFAELLSERAGKPINLNRLTRWTREDISKREQAHLGIALLAKEVFNEHREVICQPQPTRYWTRRPKRAAEQEKTTTKRKAKTK